MRKFFVLAVVVSIFAAISALPAPAQAQFGRSADANSPLSFHVDGVSDALPDIAILHYTMVGDGETIAMANKQLQAGQDAVLKSVAQYGIKPSQVEAERFGVSPVLPNSNSGRPADSAQPLGFRVIKDFKIQIPMANQSVDKLVEISDAVFQQGARLASGSGRFSDDYSGGQNYAFMEFAVTNTDALVKAATEDGISRARKLAEYAVKEMGKSKVQLVKVQANQTQAMGRSPMRSFSSGQPYVSTVWQPVHVTVSMDASFSCE